MPEYWTALPVLKCYLLSKDLQYNSGLGGGKGDKI